MRRYKLRERPTRRSVNVFLLAFASFTLGEYSEKASFTAWGKLAIGASIIVLIAVLFLLIRDFWSVEGE
jgi:hypothetical protein